MEGSWGGAPNARLDRGEKWWFSPNRLSQSCFPPARSGAWKGGGLPWPRSCISSKVGLLRTMQTRGSGGAVPLSPLVPGTRTGQNQPTGPERAHGFIPA